MKTMLVVGILCSSSAFAGTGLVTTLFSGGHESPEAIHTVPGSKLVAVGFFGNTPHGGLARYLSNGALDVTFGGNGKVGTLVGTSATHLFEFDTAQGKIVAVGNFNFGNCLSPIILRYNDDGSLDTSLGGQGMVFPAIGNCNNSDAGWLNDVKIDGSNRIVVAGVSSAGHAVVARYSWSGNPDNGFGNQGVFDVTQAVKNVGEDATNLRVKRLRLNNGMIIVAGATEVGAMIARITGTGTLDVSFGFGGVVVLPPYSTSSVGPSIDEWTWARPLGDGSILVVGDTRELNGYCGGVDFGESVMMIGHYLSNGSLDTSYGGNGTGRAAQHLPDWSSVINEIGAFDSQNRLIVGASATNATDCTDQPGFAAYLAARFTSAGILDTSFNGAGYSVVTFSPTNPGEHDYVRGVTVDATDRPVLLGFPESGGFGLACLNISGYLDTSFGP